MDSAKAQSAAANNNNSNAVYEDIEPFYEWQRDEGYEYHTLIVMLPGFRRNELKVQVTSAPILKVSAERKITENKWLRVYKEFSVPSDCNTNDLTAKFEAATGTLKIKFPKLITPTAAMPQPDETNSDKNAAKENNTTTDEAVSENTQKEKEPSRDDDDDDQVSRKTPPSVQKEKEPTAKERAGNIVKRSKTRVLDFTLSLRPTSDDQNYKDAVAGFVTGVKKMKKLMNLILVALLVIVLALYVKNAFRSSSSSLEGPQEVQEL